MNRFLLMPAALLLPSSCISVNTASQTLDAGTVYRTWVLDDHSEAYLKNGSVFIKAVQYDQRKKTPVIGPPMAQSEFISSMKTIPGTEKTVFLQFNKMDLHNPITSKDLSGIALDQNFTVLPRFSTHRAHQITIPRLRLTNRKNSSSTITVQSLVRTPSTGRKILAGFQSCMIDAPGTLIANILLIPAAIVAAPCKGLYHLCSGE